MPICAAGLGTVGGIKTFLYLHCDDLAAARRFYTGLLGLDEIYYSDGDGTVGYTIGTLQVSVAAHPQAIPIDGWSQQLGWEGGDSTTPSLGIEFDSDSGSLGLARRTVLGWLLELPGERPDGLHGRGLVFRTGRLADVGTPIHQGAPDPVMPDLHKCRYRSGVREGCTAAGSVVMCSRVMGMQS